MFLRFCTFTGKLYSDILSSYIHGQCVIFCFCIYVTIKSKIITWFFQDYFLLLGKKLPVSQDMSISRVTTGILPLGPSSNSCAGCYVWSTQSWNWMDMLLCLLPPKTGSLSPVVSDLWDLLTQIKLINCPPKLMAEDLPANSSITRGANAWASRADASRAKSHLG